MIIPTGMRYTCRTRGSVLKLVTCERCSGEYVYQLVREATGQGRSVMFLDNDGGRQRAQGYAQGRLRELLERECDPVSCPDCGYLQAPMVDVLRSRHRRWLGKLGMVWVFLSAFGLLLNVISGDDDPLIPWLIFWPVASLGVVMVVARRIMKQNFDPNTPQEMAARKSDPKQLGMRRKDFEELVASQQAAAPAGAAPPPLPEAPASLA